MDLCVFWSKRLINSSLVTPAPGRGTPYEHGADGAPSSGTGQANEVCAMYQLD